MCNKTADTDVQIEQSSAVLSPHLNHPNLVKYKTVPHVSAYRNNAVSPQVSAVIKASRIRWCENQIDILANNPSNAVLGGIQ